jgi:hypothetical protein
MPPPIKIKQIDGLEEALATLGNQGYQGNQGITGAQGLIGPQGFTGPQGLKGFQGSIGVQGLKGDQGFTGPQGFKGDQGFTGPQGFKGDQGFIGFQGITGPQGLKGDQGFTGPQGFKGDQGFQGPQGITAPQGFQGSQGFKGDQGFIGFQGITGPQGLKGDQGFTGPQGFKGDQGFQGAVGPPTTTATDSSKLPLAGGTMNTGAQIYIATSASGEYGGALQIRERGYVGSNQSSFDFAPSISFHWGNRNVQRFGVRSDGLFAVENNPIVLNTDSRLSDNRTDSSKLPLSGGTLSGTIKRTSSITGFLEGSYNNVGDNGGHTNPIYTIGGAYNPALTSLSNMYGIGYNVGGNAGVSAQGAGSGWGMYVAADGDSRIFLNASLGNIGIAGTYYGSGGGLTGNAGSLSIGGNASYATAFQRKSFTDANAEFSATEAGTKRYSGDNPNISNGPGGTWWNYETLRHSNGGNLWGTQIAWGWEDNANKLAVRCVSGGTFGVWAYYLNSANVGSFALPIGGGNLTGRTTVRGNNATGPTLGSATGAFGILSGNSLYGMYSGVSDDGSVWMQVQRNDGNTTTYPLSLQPARGSTLIGGILSLNLANSGSNAYHELNRNAISTENMFLWKTANVAKWYLGQRSSTGTDSFSLFCTNVNADAMTFSDIGNVTFRNDVSAQYYYGSGVGLTGTANGLNIGGIATGVGTRIRHLDGPRNLTDRLPNTFSREVRFDFVRANIVEGTGNYGGVMTFAPWDGTAASTGDSSYQLGFLNTSGINGSGLPGLKIRKGIDSTWGAWSTIIDSGNIASQSVNFANSAANISGNTFTLGGGSVTNSAAIGMYLNNNDTNYWIGKSAGAWTQPLDVSFYTGVRYSAHQAYGGHVFYTGGYRNLEAFSVGNGDANTRVNYNLLVTGSITASGDITAFSDIRVKENIKVIPDAIEKIKALRGVTFTRNDKDDKISRSSGVIAQEVLKVMPELVKADATGMYSVAYGNMAGLFIEAIKEQQSQIDELKELVKLLLKNKDK